MLFCVLPVKLDPQGTGRADALLAAGAGRCRQGCQTEKENSPLHCEDVIDEQGLETNNTFYPWPRLFHIQPEIFSHQFESSSQYC